ncbi:MAG: hypothetical protein JXA82_14510 [Sedimentisphaerales bacterium]|nr:hypothetical protein [Sedimentisphaerales bacterium]
MKEVDFIPEWYKSGRRRKMNYRRQYVILGCLFGAMIVGSLALGLSVSKGEEFVERTETVQGTYETIQNRFQKTHARFQNLTHKRQLLNTLDPQLQYGAVVSEITHLVPSNIMLKRLTIQAEQTTGQAQTKTKVVLSPTQKEEPTVLSETGQRFKLVMSGLSMDTSQVTRLIGNLKDSFYFHQINPGYMRNKAIKGHDYIEFEVICYLANIRDQAGEHRTNAD